MSHHDHDHLRLRTLLDQMDEGAIFFDDEGRTAQVSRRANDILAPVLPSLHDHAFDQVLSTLIEASDGDSKHTADTLLSEASRNGGGVELALRTPTGLRIISLRVRSAAQPTPGLRDRGGCTLLLVRDVTAERQAERVHLALQRRLETTLPVDPQTGLPNRKRFFEEVEREHERAKRQWDCYVVICVDIDRLTQLNATHGPLAGDRAVSAVAALLREHVRDYDTVARLDADDFGVLLPSADRAAAEAVAERLLLSAAERRVADGEAVTLCAGGALWEPSRHEDALVVVRRARENLAMAQRAGRSSISIEGSVRKVPGDGE